MPVARPLTPEEVDAGYELATGVSIVERFRELDLNPLEMPAILLKHHAPFTWGKTPQYAVDNAIALEMCCKMSLMTWQLNSKAAEIPRHILEKHHQRKHGKDAYYGQK